jgi:hypothetical protein
MFRLNFDAQGICVACENQNDYGSSGHGRMESFLQMTLRVWGLLARPEGGGAFEVCSRMTSVLLAFGLPEVLAEMNMPPKQKNTQQTHML